MNQAVVADIPRRCAPAQARRPYEQDAEIVFSDFTVNTEGSFAIAPLSIEAAIGAGDPVIDTFCPTCVLRSTAVLDSLSVVDIMEPFVIVSIALPFFVEGSFIESALMLPVDATA
jgi:hypothetical protein